MMIRQLLLTTAAALSFAMPSYAETFRFSAATPALTMDPHATNDFVTTAIFRQVYDSLVGLDLNMESVPALAESWEYLGDSTWRFNLREGVTFHDGSPMTAEDVAFSIQRATESRFYTNLLGGITDITVVDPLTLDVVSGSPDPVLPRKMARMFVMSKSWAEANDSISIPDLGAEAAEGFSVRNANGTGPMRLVSHDPSVRTEFARFEDYWGEFSGNVDTAIYNPIGAAPTRVAALLSGEIDAVVDLPIQDVERLVKTPGFKVLEAPHLFAIQFELDGTRDLALGTTDKSGEPLTSNPFKDTRVRLAMAHAIDAELVVDRVMRGHAKVLGSAAVQGIAGYQPDLDVRWETDIDKAKTLLAEAGYPDGFATTLNCPLERYINAEDTCRAAASMLARIGIDVTVNGIVWPDFARILVNDRASSFHLIGSGSASWDAQDTFTSTMMTYDADEKEGLFNWAMYSNPIVDEVSQKLPVTFEPDERTALYRQGLIAANETVHAIYMYQPMLLWGMSDKIDAPIRGDATLTLQNVTVN